MEFLLSALGSGISAVFSDGSPWDPTAYVSPDIYEDLQIRPPPATDSSSAPLEGSTGPTSANVASLMTGYDPAPVKDMTETRRQFEIPYNLDSVYTLPSPEAGVPLVRLGHVKDPTTGVMYATYESALPPPDTDGEDSNVNPARGRALARLQGGWSNDTPPAHRRQDVERGDQEDLAYDLGIRVHGSMDRSRVTSRFEAANWRSFDGYHPTPDGPVSAAGGARANQVGNQGTVRLRVQSATPATNRNNVNEAGGPRARGIAAFSTNADAHAPSPAEITWMPRIRAEHGRASGAAPAPFLSSGAEAAPDVGRDRSRHTHMATQRSWSEARPAYRFAAPPSRGGSGGSGGAGEGSTAATASVATFAPPSGFKGLQDALAASAGVGSAAVSTEAAGALGHSRWAADPRDLHVPSSASGTAALHHEATVRDGRAVPSAPAFLPDAVQPSQRIAGTNTAPEAGLSRGGDGAGGGKYMLLQPEDHIAAARQTRSGLVAAGDHRVAAGAGAGAVMAAPSTSMVPAPEQQASARVSGLFSAGGQYANTGLLPAYTLGPNGMQDTRTRTEAAEWAPPSVRTGMSQMEPSHNRGGETHGLPAGAGAHAAQLVKERLPSTALTGTRSMDPAHNWGGMTHGLPVSAGVGAAAQQLSKERLPSSALTGTMSMGPEHNWGGRTHGLSEGAGVGAAAQQLSKERLPSAAVTGMQALGPEHNRGGMTHGVPEGAGVGAAALQVSQERLPSAALTGMNLRDPLADPGVNSAVVAGGGGAAAAASRLHQERLPSSALTGTYDMQPAQNQGGLTHGMPMGGSAPQVHGYVEAGAVRTGLTHIPPGTGQALSNTWAGHGMASLSTAHATVTPPTARAGLRVIPTPHAAGAGSTVHEFAGAGAVHGHFSAPSSSSGMHVYDSGTGTNMGGGVGEGRGAAAVRPMPSEPPSVRTGMVAQTLPTSGAAAAGGDVSATSTTQRASYEPTRGAAGTRLVHAPTSAVHATTGASAHEARPAVGALERQALQFSGMRVQPHVLGVHSGEGQHQGGRPSPGVVRVKTLLERMRSSLVGNGSMVDPALSGVAPEPTPSVPPSGKKSGALYQVRIPSSVLHGTENSAGTRDTRAQINTHTRKQSMQHNAAARPPRAMHAEYANMLVDTPIVGESHRERGQRPTESDDVEQAEGENSRIFSGGEHSTASPRLTSVLTS